MNGEKQRSPLKRKRYYLILAALLVLLFFLYPRQEKTPDPVSRSNAEQPTSELQRSDANDDQAEEVSPSTESISEPQTPSQEPGAHRKGRRHH